MVLTYDISGPAPTFCSESREVEVRMEGTGAIIGSVLLEVAILGPVCVLSGELVSSGQQDSTHDIH